jgi:hypothetical protein
MAGALALVAGASTSGCYGTFWISEPTGSDAGSPDAGGPDAHANGDGGGTDATLPALRFTQVSCDPAVHLGAAIPEGGQVGCAFTVEGPSGRPAELGCLDDQGDPLDCAPGGGWPPMVIQPAGPQPLPLTGLFFMDTQGLAGQQVTLYWEAHSVDHRAEYRLSFPVDPPELQVPPDLQVICGGDPDGFVSVNAGDRLACTVTLAHPDPLPDLGWWVFWPPHPSPVHEPTPREGQGSGSFSWSWQTDPTESGRQMIFAFRAGSTQTPVAGVDLTVEVY